MDDVIVLMRNREDFLKLAQDLNNATNLNIEWNISNQEAIYLDLKICKGHRFRQYSTQDVEIYTKPISKFLYLHGTSSHPKHVFTGIVKGEIIRFLRNTSDHETWTRKVKMLFNMLIQRGYTKSILKNAIKDIKYENRYKYLLSLIHI